MGRTTLVRIDEELVKTLEEIKREISIKTKKEFGLVNLDVTGTTVSRILAQRINENKNQFKIKVRKTNNRHNHGLIFLGN